MGYPQVIHKLYTACGKPVEKPEFVSNVRFVTLRCYDYVTITHTPEPHRRYKIVMKPVRFVPICLASLSDPHARLRVTKKKGSSNDDYSNCNRYPHPHLGGELQVCRMHPQSRVLSWHLHYRSLQGS